MAAKLLVSDRHSEYKSGLDDDGFFDDFLSFPEKGEADQQSAELQLTGEFGRLRLRRGPLLVRGRGQRTARTRRSSCSIRAISC